MSRWFRVYDDLVDDPKVQRLPGEMVKALLNLWCLASQNDGILPAADDIAFKLRMTTAKVQQVLSVLGECGLIDSDEDALRPHNWNARQYKSDTTDPTAPLRQKAYRERLKNRNATVTVTDTRADTEQITETNTKPEQKKEARVTALADGWPTDFREQFWAKYPNKVGKPKALAKLESCMHRGIEFAAIMAGLENYIVAKPADRAWLNPETFINQERWADQPAAVTNGRRTVHQAADDLLAKLRAFDEPAPDGLCDGAGQAAVRLLPPH